jgi:uncharacterized caspase-like protein
MRCPFAIAYCLMLLVSGCLSAHAEKRVALVVGIDKYPALASEHQLQKAVNDARAIGDALRQIGFEVIRGENLSRLDLSARLDEFTRKLEAGDTALFFFAGHGVSLGGIQTPIHIEAHTTARRG